MRTFQDFDVGALRSVPGIAFYFRYPLHHTDFKELREGPRGRLLGRYAAKPLYGRLTKAGQVDRSAGYNGRIAIIYLPPRARTATSAELMFTRMPKERVTLPNGRRNWPAIRQAAERAIRHKLGRRAEHTAKHQL